MTAKQCASEKPTPPAAPRRGRRSLLRGTALQTAGVLVLVLPAHAQLSPVARPQGGVVAAGQASIKQTGAQTTVNQTSQRAVVDWQSFNVGSQHTVAFQQPGATAMALNRIVGPDPSQIAGRITANGQIAIVNQSGVVFQKGSVVDVQALVVSSANISNQNFMAGRGPGGQPGQLVFDQPGKPDARIVNAGTITVRQGGLAALVAPQVANSGVINARMGKVVLAGAEAHTIDLYGDGLMSIDVTREVRRAPTGGMALVTNTGTIAADGGTVVLTAQAADGIVSNLINNTGRVRANSLPGHAGSVLIAGVGGSVTIEGDVQSNGHGAGVAGGSIEMTASDTVTLAPSARVSASGQGGGGTIALGTTLARTRAQGVPGTTTPPSTARNVAIAAGARVDANGRGGGSGGQIAVLSTQNTAMAGSLSARGGKKGGDGGQVEVSGEAGLTLTGTVDASAPAGKAGTLLIDPSTIIVLPGSQPQDGLLPTVLPSSSNANVAAVGSDAIDRLLSGNMNVILSATNDVSISAPITGTGDGKLIVRAGGSIVVNSAITLPLTGLADVELEASYPGIYAAGVSTLGQVAINAPVSARTIMISAGAGIVINADLTGSTSPGTAALPNFITLRGAADQSGGVTLPGQNYLRGIITETPAATITTASLSARGSDVSLVGQNQVSVLTSSFASGSTPGSFVFTNTVPLTLSGGNLFGPPNAAITANGTVSISNTAPVIVAAQSGNGGAGITGTSIGISVGSGDLTIAAKLAGAPTGTVILGASAGAVTEAASGSIATGTLIASGVNGVALESPDNAVRALGLLSATAGSVSLVNSGPLTVSGPVAAQNSVSLVADSLNVNAAISGSTVDLTSRGALNVSAGVVANAGQTIRLQSDSPAFGPGGSLSVPGGTVVVTPVTPGRSIRLSDLVAASTPGNITAGTLQIGDGNTGAITIDVPVILTGLVDTLDLRSGSVINETGPGGIAVAALAASGVAGVTLNGPNQIGTLVSADSVGGQVSLSNGQPLIVSGSVTGNDVALNTIGNLSITGTVTAANSVSLNSTGDLSIGGSVTGPNSVSLSSAAGSIIEAGGGAISTGALTATASNDIVLGSLQNQVGTMGPVRSRGGSVTVSDNLPLTVSGPVTGNDITLTTTGGDLAVVGPVIGTGAVALSSSTGAVTISGTGSVVGGNVALTSAQSITASAGSRLQAGGELDLNSGQSATTLAGTVSAPKIVVRAGPVLLNGGTIATGDARSATASPTSSAAGAFFEAGQFTQTGTTTVAPLGTGFATVRVDIQRAGAVSLASLNAPATNLILSLGGGSLSGGPVIVNGLTVGGLGSGNLNAIVGSKSGAAAAALTQLLLGSSTAYRVNGCAIGGCSASVPVDVLATLTAIGADAARVAILPSQNPLKDITLGFFRTDEDEDLLVPNVSDQGM